MIIYLDVSCLNRPFDDQAQPRVRLEAAAVAIVLEMTERGDARHVSSEIADIEVAAMPDVDRRQRVAALLPAKSDTISLNAAIFRRAETLVALGFKAADALHIACAEAQDADVFLSCDDRLTRTARRHADQLRVLVANPLEWLKEHRR